MSDADFIYETFSIVDDTPSDRLILSFSGRGKRIIDKLIIYEKIRINGPLIQGKSFHFYNLAFGDFIEENGGFSVNDHAISENGDGHKVLKTVLSTIHTFFI